MIFVDDFTRMMWVTFLKEKSKAIEKFKIFKNRVENESSVKNKCLRLDRTGEFTSREFDMFCEEIGIKRHLLSPKTPTKNGIARWRNGSISEASREIMYENDVSKTFWREAFNTVVYTMNIVHIEKGMNKTPYEL